MDRKSERITDEQIAHALRFGPRTTTQLAAIFRKRGDTINDRLHKCSLIHCIGTSGKSRTNIWELITPVQ
jgi:hypothetical protein